MSQNPLNNQQHTGNMSTSLNTLNLAPLNIDGQTVFVNPINIDGQTVYLTSVNPNDLGFMSNIGKPQQSQSPSPAVADFLKPDQGPSTSHSQNKTTPLSTPMSTCMSTSYSHVTTDRQSFDSAMSHIKSMPMSAQLHSLHKPVSVSGPKISNGDGTRKLLLPWLMEHLDNKSFDGVQWSDRDHGVFFLPWKHGKNKGFDEEKDGEIFKEWAINTGRYRPGDPPQYKVWKATLRNALHKHPYIQKMEEFGKNGQYRVYRIMYNDLENKKSTTQMIKLENFTPKQQIPNPISTTENTIAMGPPPLTPKTPMQGMMGPGTPQTPQNTDTSSPHIHKNNSPQEYRCSDSILSPHSNLSSVGSAFSNESEYPTDLEMSPGSSVVTTVDVVNLNNTSKHHIRSASGTVLTDIDEVIKQVTLPAMEQSTFDNDTGFSEYSDLDRYLLEKEALRDDAMQVHDKPTMLVNNQKIKPHHTQDVRVHISEEELQQQIYQKLQQQHQQNQQNQTFAQQNNQTVQQNQQSLQERLQQQHAAKMEQNHQEQQMLQQQIHQHQQKQQQQLQHMQLQQHQQQQQQSTQQKSSVVSPNLNPKQQQKLLQLKKLRESLKTGPPDTKMEHDLPAVDDFPAQELLGNDTPDRSVRRLGKRPRIDSSSDISSTANVNSANVDIMAELKKLGLPKKQSPNIMAITIYYRTTGVAAYGISNPVGARLYYCSNQRVQVTDEKTTNELYGPQDATQVCMPWCRESTTTQTLLGTLTRGLILQEVDGDVFATRLCQCAVFFGDKRGVLTKLERGVRVKIFDFNNRFLPQYFQHLRSNSGASNSVLDPLPDADVMLSFGQRWDDKRPIEKTLIWAKVIHLKARQLIIDFTQMFPPPPPISNEDCIQFSESDPYDRLADAFSLAL